MKKLYLLSVGILLSAGVFSQAFWDGVSYKGAFPVTDGTTGINSNDWTAGWTEWDPENKTYPAINDSITADITSNTTLSASKVYLLKNKVYIKNNATLTIPAGTVIRGDKTTEGTIIVTRGAKIVAQGSKSQPIVFTSNEASGLRAPGDWGGIVVLGNGVNNQPGGVAYIEGLPNTPDTQFGGTNDNDSSGVLSYIRIEFAGIPFQPNKEINGITFGSVGGKTKVDHVQVSFANDDSFEWFGGTVDGKYLIAFRGLDDDFDTDFGFRGRIQFGVIVRDADLSDAAGDSNGWESDNDASGTAAQPLTAAVFSNITVIGPKRDGTTALPAGEKFEKSWRIRRNSSISIFNSVTTGWEKGLSIESSATEDNFAGDTAVFANNLLMNYAGGTNYITASQSFYATNIFPDNNDTSKTIAQVAWVNAFPTALTSTPDFRLTGSSSAAATGASFTNAKFAGQVAYAGIENSSVADGVALYPNPAQNKTTLAFNLSKSTKINAVVYDITGKEVSIIRNNEIIAAGQHTITIPTMQLSSGMYFVNLNSDSFNKVVKLIVE